MSDSAIIFYLVFICLCQEHLASHRSISISRVLTMETVNETILPQEVGRIVINENCCENMWMRIMSISLQSGRITTKYRFSFIHSAIFVICSRSVICCALVIMFFYAVNIYLIFCPFRSPINPVLFLVYSCLFALFALYWTGGAYESSYRMQSWLVCVYIHIPIPAVTSSVTTAGKLLQATEHSRITLV